MANEVMKKEDFALTVQNALNVLESASEDLDGLNIQFPRIKIPSGGGVAFEVPSDDPENPDLAKEIKAVILYSHPVHAYYADEYTGGSNPPDCGSMDGRQGFDRHAGVVKTCATCPFNQFGSSDSGGKACKQKRRLYLLKEGDVLPTILTIPTGSLSAWSTYIQLSLLRRGKRANNVVTRLSLKKAQNKGGITYSQAVFMLDRTLSGDELVAVEQMTQQVKGFAQAVGVEYDAVDDEPKRIRDGEPINDPGLPF